MGESGGGGRCGRGYVEDGWWSESEEMIGPFLLRDVSSNEMGRMGDART